MVPKTPDRFKNGKFFNITVVNVEELNLLILHKAQFGQMATIVAIIA